MNIVAVYKLDGCLHNVCCREGSSFYENHLQQCKEYEEFGAELVSCIITNNEEVFYKSRLKAMLMELRETVKRNAEWLQYVEKNSTPEVVEQTKRLIAENEETLMKRVAIRCSSLLYRNIPIEDELALACYDYRHQQLNSI